MPWSPGKYWGAIPWWWVAIVVVIIVAAAIAIGVTLAKDGGADTTAEGEHLATTSSVGESTTTETTPLESTSTTDNAQTSTSTTLPPAATTSSSTTTSLWIPPIQINPGVVLLLPTRYEDTHPYLQWVGTWTTQTSSVHSGGSAKRTGTLNSRVGIEFEGTGVRLISYTPAAAGILWVHLYGNSVDISETINLTGAGESQVAVWSSGTLSDGQYQCWFGYDPTTTPGYDVTVDAIDVWGTVLEP